MAANTPEDICNAALRRIQYPTPIGIIYEGSPAARVALDYYGETRDALLTEFDWPFAGLTVNLGNPIKQAPAGGYMGNPWNPATNPPPQWIYEYAYPANALKIRSVRPVPTFIPESMPRWNGFDTIYDSQLGAKAIVTNLPASLAVITYQVTDPTEWQHPQFTDTLIERLAVLFSRNLSDPNMIQLTEREAVTKQGMATQESP